jgi:hypothetical protein
MSLVRKQEDRRDGRTAPRALGSPLTVQAQRPVRRSGTGVVNKATAARARVRLPGDVNEPLVDERSVVSCRWPTSLKNEGATQLSFFLQ